MLFALLSPVALAAQGIENPTEAELMATAELIEFPSAVVDTFTMDDPHIAGTASRMYRFRGSAGDSVTIYVGSATLDMLVVLGDSGSGGFEMVDDDSGPAADAVLDVHLPADGVYHLMVIPSREREYGVFSIELVAGARARAGRDEDDAETVHPKLGTQLRWAKFGSSQTSVAYYDRESFVVSGNVISVRVRLAYLQIRQPDGGPAYDSRMMGVEMRCATRDYRVRTLVDTRGGVPVDRAESEGDFSTIPAGSMLEGLLDLIC